MPGLFCATKPKKFTVLIYLFLSKRSLLYQSSRRCRRIGLTEFSTLCEFLTFSEDDKLQIRLHPREGFLWGCPHSWVILSSFGGVSARNLNFYFSFCLLKENRGSQGRKILSSWETLPGSRRSKSISGNFASWCNQQLWCFQESLNTKEKIFCIPQRMERCLNKVAKSISIRCLKSEFSSILKVVPDGFIESGC